MTSATATAIGKSVSPRAAEGGSNQKHHEEEAGHGRKRACDYCHRVKMRCTGQGDPPCDRCRQMGHKCTFKERKTRADRMQEGTSRIKQLESQLQSLHDSVQVQHVELNSRSEQEKGCMEGILGVDQTGDNEVQSYTPSSPFLTGDNNGSGTVDLPSGGEPPATVQYGDGDTDDTEVLTPHIINPLNAMCSLGEAARLRKSAGNEGLWGSSMSPDPSDATSSTQQWLASTLGSGSQSARGDTTNGTGPSSKKRKLESISAFEKRTSQGEDELRQSTRKHKLCRLVDGVQVPDVIDLGICDEATGRRLFRLFMDSCSVYMPCFDPEFDTFDSIRARSAFCLTAMIMVGAKVTDPRGHPSKLQRQCKEHAELLGKDTLFTPSASLEDVQAMIVLASWGDTSWRPGGQASRMATDLKLYTCLPRLVAGGLGQSKSGKDLKTDWPLVEGARIWLTLYKLEHEMSFNLGHPCMLGGPESIKYCRELLKHPLSVEKDARLVAACELSVFQLPMHDPLALPTPISTVHRKLAEQIKQHERDTEGWYLYWDRYLADRGAHRREFIRESLITMRAGARLNISTRLLHELNIQQGDHGHSPTTIKSLAAVALRAAQRIVSMALRSGQYTLNLKYANVYTHLNIAFAAQCLIGLNGLIPNLVDIVQLSRDVQQTSDLLLAVSDFEYAKVLRMIIARARKDNFLPHSTRSPSTATSQRPPFDVDIETSSSQPIRTGAGERSVEDDLDSIFHHSGENALFTNTELDVELALDAGSGHAGAPPLSMGGTAADPLQLNSGIDTPWSMPSNPPGTVPVTGINGEPPSYWGSVPAGLDMSVVHQHGTGQGGEIGPGALLSTTNLNFNNDSWFTFPSLENSTQVGSGDPMADFISLFRDEAFQSTDRST